MLEIREAAKTFADWWTALTSDKGQKLLLTTDKTRKKINEYRHEPTLSIFAFIKRRNQCTFFSLGSNHIKFFTYQIVERKEFPPLFDT